MVLEGNRSLLQLLALKKVSERFITDRTCSSLYPSFHISVLAAFPSRTLCESSGVIIMHLYIDSVFHRARGLRVWPFL